MNTALIQTAISAVDPQERELTRRMPYDDWVVPEPRSASNDPGKTSADDFSNATSAPVETTNQVVRLIEMTPYRRDIGPQCPPETRIKLLQQWECIVLRVDDECVECELHDLTNEGVPVEYAEVYLEQFNQFDRNLLQPGAVFYWSVGCKTRKTGQVEGFSQLRVRRMPDLSRQKKLDIEQRAARLRELFNSHS